MANRIVWLTKIIYKTFYAKCLQNTSKEGGSRQRDTERVQVSNYSIKSTIYIDTSKARI